MIILGIDPGTARLGFGIIKKRGEGFVCIKSGTIFPKAKKLPERLAEINKELALLIKKYKPGLVGVEKVYFSKNQKTALDVAHARGVVLLRAAENGIPCLEIAPTEVKLAIAGDGRASKKSVAKMAGHLLNIKAEGILDDTTDALAVAIVAEALYKRQQLTSSA